MWSGLVSIKKKLKIQAYMTGFGLVLFFGSVLLKKTKGLCIGCSLIGIASAYNAILGINYGKMHMQLGEVVTRKSRGEFWFKMDIVVQLAMSLLFFWLSFLFLIGSLLG